MPSRCWRVDRARLGCRYRSLCWHCSALPAAQHAALSGGDDYVLAFTRPPAQLPDLQAAGWPVQVIGRVEVGQGVVLIDSAGADITPDIRGYQHFGDEQ